MSAIKVGGGIPQRSPEWLAARRHGITATDVPAILGVSPFTDATPVGVWLSKREDTPPIAETEAMRWGTKLEPTVAEHYRENNSGVWLDESPPLLQHHEHPWMLASVDCIAHHRDAGDPWIVEIKTSKRPYEDDVVPQHVWCQVQWQMAVLELDRADVAALFHGSRYQQWTIERDDDWIQSITDHCRGWWQLHVRDGVRPEIDPERDAALLPRIWTPQPGKQKEIPPHLVEMWAASAAAMKAAKEAEEAVKVTIQDAMENAEEATVGGEVVGTWRATKPRVTIDADALRRDGLYDHYTKTGTAGRMFRMRGNL